MAVGRGAVASFKMFSQRRVSKGRYYYNNKILYIFAGTHTNKSASLIRHVIVYYDRPHVRDSRYKTCNLPVSFRGTWVYERDAGGGGCFSYERFKGVTAGSMGQASADRCRSSNKVQTLCCGEIYFNNRYWVNVPKKHFPFHCFAYKNRLNVYKITIHLVFNS